MTLVPIFEALGKMLQEKKKKSVKKKKKVCGLCTDVKVKLIKTRQRTVAWWFFSLGIRTLQGLERNDIYFPSMPAV